MSTRWRRRHLAVLAAIALIPLMLGATPPNRQMRWIMGTFWEIDTPDAPSPVAMAAAFDEIRRLDDLLSHYKADSALSKLNAAGQGTVVPELAGLIARSLAYSRESRGAFDITVAPLVEAWGFKDMVTRLPTPEALRQARAVVGWRRVTVSGNAVRLAPGTRLEFGAIGKGYALDRAMQVLTSHGIRRARIDAGGQHLVRGTWTIGIEHPRQDRILGRLTITDGSVSTAGDADRFFEHAGIRYNHHIDPRTGWASTGYPCVTVVAPTAESADALSTLATIAGPTEAGPILKAHKAEALWYDSEGQLVTTPGFRWQREPDASPDPATGN
ncbi:MAG: FAD:protein FMN transferase [Candidatus Sericytochromatia bacterium]|nr:FAD:protein FMN transferase [Candidatus Sericytochromatia bacterium]